MKTKAKREKILSTQAIKADRHNDQVRLKVLIKVTTQFWVPIYLLVALTSMMLFISIFLNILDWIWY